MAVATLRVTLEPLMRERVAPGEAAVQATVVNEGTQPELFHEHHPVDCGPVFEQHNPVVYVRSVLRDDAEPLERFDGAIAVVDPDAIVRPVDVVSSGLVGHGPLLGQRVGAVRHGQEGGQGQARRPHADSRG